MKSLSELKVELEKQCEPFQGKTKIFNIGFEAGAHAVMERAKVLVEAMKQSLDYAQDQLARANKEIATDCAKCDYQCKSCIRSIDDCDSLKKIVNSALLDWADFVKEK